MRLQTIFFATVVVGFPVFGQPVVSNIRADGVSHSSLRLLWDNSTSINKVRVRYGLTTNYEGGAGGGILQYGTGTYQQAGATETVSGLAPGTTYHFCPQSSSDGGSTWSACVDFAQATGALPSPHPAVPVAPTTFTTDYPSTTGYTAVTVASDCSDLQSQLNAAATRQTTGGTVITIPHGTVCSAASYTMPTNGNANTFQSTAVNTSTDQITLIAHGFTDQQKVRLVNSGGCLPTLASFPPGLNCHFAGILWGTDYYIKYVDADTFQLSATAGGPAISLTDQGNGTDVIMAWPPPSNWVVVTTDGTLTPEKVRVSPAFQPQMATISNPTRFNYNGNFLFADAATNWRFVGIEFTHADFSADANTTADPPGVYGMIASNPSAGNIILDRCYIHGLGYPNRLYRAILAFDGENMGIIDSYLEKLDWWHPYRSPNGGWNPSSPDSAHVSITAGTYYYGQQTVTTTDVTITITSGSASGTGYMQLRMDGTLSVILPTGMTATCSGYSPCSVTTSASPGWVTDANGRVAGTWVGTINLSSGLITSVSNPGEPSTGVTEGAQSFIAGLGPGPFVIQDNYISSTGVPMHFDDSGGGVFFPHDYTVTRNYFTAPLSQIADGPATDHSHYWHRTHLEWKNGQRIQVNGNIFENSFSDVTAGGPLMITPRSGGYITDLDITNNTFRLNGGGLGLAGAIDSYMPVSKPGARYRVANNLMYGENGYIYNTPITAPGGRQGIQMGIGYGAEDIIIRHNTLYDNRGYAADWLHVTQSPIEGIYIADNLIFANTPHPISNESLQYNTPSCTGSDKALMDCDFTSGPGNTSYVGASNTFIPGWNDNRPPVNPIDPAIISTNFNGLPGLSVVTGSDTSTRVAYVQWANPGLTTTADFHLQSGSPYAAGGAYPASDATDRGANVDALNQAQGAFGAITVTPEGISSATIAAYVPDAGASCLAAYGTGTDPTAWSRSSVDTANSRSRSISLSGLSTGTYYGQVWCSGTAPSSTFSFNMGGS